MSEKNQMNTSKEKKGESKQGRNDSRKSKDSQRSGAAITSPQVQILSNLPAQNSSKDNRNNAQRSSRKNPVSGDERSSTVTLTSTKQGRRSNTSMKFGFIVSIKETFGFIQDFVNDDQIFFSLREIKNLDTLNIGDIIQYKELNGPKGLSAENISIPPLEQLECLGTYEGIVTRECDAHRFIPGCVKLSNDNIKKENTENVIQKQDSGELAYEDFSITEMKSSLSDSSPRSKLPDLISFIYVNNQNSITFSGKPKIIKGDYIEFQLYGIQSIGLYQGRHMRVMKTKKELQRQDQIDRMLNAGATREEGIIDAIKPGDYGFIKPADQPDQIYFRVDDFVDENVTPKEGMEVSFFVITELSKGKHSSRAIHLQVLAPGTVELESIVAKNVFATIIATPKYSPTNSNNEMPGKLKLFEPVKYDQNEEIVVLDTVELWARCVPENIVFQVGDVVKIDVLRYRPEKLYFARSVRVLSFRKIGRELGYICSVRDTGFGFITPYNRDSDIYFKRNEVLGDSGSFLKENEVVENLIVSFDVIVEESRNQPENTKSQSSNLASKLRAARVKIETLEMSHATSAKLSGNQGEGSEGSKKKRKEKREREQEKKDREKQLFSQELNGNNFFGIYTLSEELTETETILKALIESNKFGQSRGSHIFLKANVNGIINREAKRDSPGTIRTGTDINAMGYYQPRFNCFYPPDLVLAFLEFSHSKYLTDVTFEFVPVSLRRLYHNFADEFFPTQFGHESIETNVEKNSKLKHFHIWKKNSDDETVPKSLVTVENEEREKDLKENHDDRVHEMNVTQDEILVFYNLSDVNEDYGALTKHFEVVFDYYIDRKTNRKVAKRVMLTEESIPGYENEQIGVLEVVNSMGKNGRYGFIRCIPTDEKLFWHCSGLISPVDQSNLLEGKEVSFHIRKRGGMRCAMDIKLLTSGSLSQDVTITTETCLGVIVQNRNEPTGDADSGDLKQSHQVILIDISACNTLKTKIWNAEKLTDLLRELSDAEQKSTATKESTAAGTDALEVTSEITKLALDDEIPFKSGGDCSETEETQSSVKAPDVVGMIKYFTPLPRIPIKVRTSESASEEFSAGDIIECSVVMNWSKQRQPVEVTAVKPHLVDEKPLQLVRMKGTVTRTKIRYNGGFGSENSTLCDVCEIISQSHTGKDSPIDHKEKNGMENVRKFYCDIRDIRDNFNNSVGSLVQVGDEVEFYGVISLGQVKNLAVDVISSAGKGDHEIQFKRGQVNTTLKIAKLKAGFKGISMAKGPQDNSDNVGFVPGWRESPNLSNIPWKHLLRHLHSSTISATAPEFIPASKKSDHFSSNEK